MLYNTDKYTSKNKHSASRMQLASVSGGGAAHVVTLRDDKLGVARRRERVR